MEPSYLALPCPVIIGNVGSQDPERAVPRLPLPRPLVLPCLQEHGEPVVLPDTLGAPGLLSHGASQHSGCSGVNLGIARLLLEILPAGGHVEEDEEVPEHGDQS